MRRSSWRSRIGAILLALILVAGCRPAIADVPDGGADGAPDATPAPGRTFFVAESDRPTETEAPSTGPATPEPSLEEIATAVPAEALKPSTQVNVQVRLFHGFEATDAALLYADALKHYTSVNLIVDIAPPIAGYDIFAVDPAPDVIPVWIGTAADAAASAAAGLKLQAVGELTGRDATLLIVPKKGPRTVATLKGQVLFDNPQAAAALQAGGLPATATLVPPADPGAPFDPTALLDGTAAAAAVSSYEGWARIQEAAAAAGLADGAFVATPLHKPDAPILGELIWVQPSDLAGDPDLKAAVTAFLGAVAQAQVECKDNIDDCASIIGAQSDRTPEGIAWSIDQLDAALFPSSDGILHIDAGEWDRTVALLTAGKVSGAVGLTFTNDLVDKVLAALASLDVHGTGFKPEGRPLFP